MWEISSSDQALSFLLSAALGAAACAFYCIFRAVRREHGCGRLRVFFQDLVFWLVFTLATYCFFLLRCCGEVRGYVYLGELAGFVLFYVALAKPITAIFGFLYRCADRVWRLLCLLGNKTLWLLCMGIEKTADFTVKITKIFKKKKKRA